jgi:hypothetical protein
MASQPARHLHIVDPRSGEVLDECPTCNEWARKYNGVLSQLGQMRIELEGEFQSHELFPRCKKLHDYWRERCRHPRTTFTVEDFKVALPRLKEHDDEMCRHAIDGAAFDPFVTQRKNGSQKRHDDWELIMRKGKFEEFCNKAPWHLPDPAKVKVLADALAFLNPHMPLPECVAEATRRLS